MSAWSLGFSYGYHDSSVAAINEEGVQFSSHLERFSRVKFDSRFPYEVLSWLSEEIDFTKDLIVSINYFELPELKFYRQIGTLLANWPQSLELSKYIPTMFGKSRKFRTKEILGSIENILGRRLALPKINFWPHHQSHAASAFFLSPFQKSIVIVVDAVGEIHSTTVWLGDRNSGTPLKLIDSQDFPDSYGVFYSMMTLYCGFKINTGEYKLMGLAPYGQPAYKDLLKKDFVRIHENGFLELNRKYLDFLRSTSMHSNSLAKLLGQPPRSFGESVSQFYADVAASTQALLEEGIFRLIKHSRKVLGMNLPVCMAGGVALNATANGKLSNYLGNDFLFIPPAAGDAGGALGSAILGLLVDSVAVDLSSKLMLKSARIGKQYSERQVSNLLDSLGIKYTRPTATQIGKLLSEGKIVGWFEGREEWGPRALGGRSILADPRVRLGQITINEKIKFRESFRPFAPIVLEEFAEDFFTMTGKSPHMLKVFGVKDVKFIGTNIPTPSDSNYFGPISIRERISTVESPIPAATHLDGSARVQTLSREESPLLHEVIRSFKHLTSIPILINTSFNVRGEPIVHSPNDALNCFFTTGLDYLFIQGYLIDKEANLSLVGNFKRELFDED